MKTRRLCLVVLLLALLAVVALPAALAEGGTFGLVYNSATVNLRQQPSQSSSWLGSYPRGEWVRISGESGNWYYVTGPDGKNGYMSKNYIQVSNPGYATVAVVSNPKSTSFLNLRESPSYSARVVDIYYNGVPCQILSYSGGWYQVLIDGTTRGYFRQEYITTRSWPFASEVATIVTPNNSGLNLREGPGKNYPVMAQYKGGNYVMVVQKGADWWKVVCNGKVGYMDASFLRDGVHKPTGASSGSSSSGSSSGSSSSGSSSSGSSGDYQGYAIVSNPRSTQVLNMRALPSTSSKSLAQYRNGVRVTVLQAGTEWCKVKNAKGVVGYMMTDYLTVYNQTGALTMTVDHPDGTFVNLRSAPSMSTGKILARIPHGANVTVLAPQNGWVKVRYNGQTGYVVNYFLD